MNSIELNDTPCDKFIMVLVMVNIFYNHTANTHPLQLQDTANATTRNNVPPGGQGNDNMISAFAGAQYFVQLLKWFSDF